MIAIAALVATTTFTTIFSTTFATGANDSIGDGQKSKRNGKEENATMSVRVVSQRRKKKKINSRGEGGEGGTYLSTGGADLDLGSGGCTCRGEVAVVYRVWWFRGLGLVVTRWWWPWL